MSTPYIIKEILKKYNITDFLSKKGIEPARTSDARDIYICPIPDHKDSAPSFCVVKNQEQEFFYCFGCQEHGNILDLYSLMNRVTLGRSIGELSAGIELIEGEDYTGFIDGVVPLDTGDELDNFDDCFFQISAACGNYLKLVNYVGEEVGFIENVLQNVDCCLKEMDYDNLRIIRQNIGDWLSARCDYYRKKQEEEFLIKLKRESDG